MDLNTTDGVVHKHTPYIVILVKITKEWANTHGGNLPSTREEKRQFKVLDIFLYAFKISVHLFSFGPSNVIWSIP